MTSQRRGGFTACILGHSFVRRLHDAITCEDHDVAHRAPDSLRVVRLFSQIDIFGCSGYTVSELRHEVLAAGLQHRTWSSLTVGPTTCQECCDVEQVTSGLVICWLFTHIIWRQVGDANGHDPEDALPWRWAVCVQRTCGQTQQPTEGHVWGQAWLGVHEHAGLLDESWWF